MMTSVKMHEAASMLPVAALLDDFHGQKTQNEQLLAVDVCAAPGGKSVQLISTSKEKITLIANEVSSSRLASLAHNVQRCGTCERTVLTHGDGGQLLTSLRDLCDLVLVDAPCSGDTQSRRLNISLAAHIRSAPSPQQTERLAKEQKRLLLAAVDAAKPGSGLIVYSTCSLDPAENEDIVNAVLNERSDLVLFPPPTAFSHFQTNALLPGTVRLWPHDTHNTAGFFCARFKRLGNTIHTSPFKTKEEHITSQQGRRQQKLTSYYNQKANLNIFEPSDAVTNYFLRHFGIPDLPAAFPQSKLMRRGTDLWLVPSRIPDCLLSQLNRPGVKLLQAFGNKPTSNKDLENAIKADRVRCTHDFALAAGHLSSCPLLLHETNHLLAYLRGEDFMFQIDSAIAERLKQEDSSITILVAAAKPLLHPHRHIILGLAKLLPPNKREDRESYIFQIKNQLPRDLARRDVHLNNFFC